jgi:hypothetical protein
VGQKSHTFWADVHSRYARLQEKSVSPETKFPRTWNQLKGRFLLYIQVQVNVFNRYYKKAAKTIPSGNASPVSSIMHRAMEQYQLEQGKPFRFLLCVPILHKIPKFNPMTIEVVDVSGQNEKVPSPAVGSVMGSKLERPMGCKQAKILKKEEDSTMRTITTIRSDFNKLVQLTICKEAFEELLA